MSQFTWDLELKEFRGAPVKKDTLYMHMYRLFYNTVTVMAFVTGRLSNLIRIRRFPPEKVGIETNSVNEDDFYLQL